MDHNSIITIVGKHNSQATMDYLGGRGQDTFGDLETWPKVSAQDSKQEEKSSPNYNPVEHGG